jgi:hypothetical protein
LRVGIIAILHTFNGQLKFNSHVHTMVTGGGLHGSSHIWVSRVYYERDALIKSWRKAVIALLRAALRAGQRHTTMTVDQMEEMLTQQEKCSWIIKIQSFEDKWHFLQYAGRYVRRPPVARRRIAWIGERTARFWYKDKRLRRKVEVQCSLKAFIDRLGQHIPEGLSARFSELWAVCFARSRANFRSYLCNSETEAKAPPQASPLGAVYRAGLRI